MRRLIVTIVLVASSTTLAACRATTAPCVAEWPPVRIAIANPRVEQTPVHDTFAFEALTELPLLVLDRSGQLAPGLAESWETRDRQTWTFTLRANIHSHTGVALTAERLRQHFLETIAKPANHVRIWRDLQAIEAPAPNRLVFRFAQPVSLLPEALMRMTSNINDASRSAGPWRITRETRDEMDLEAFPAVAAGVLRPTKIHVVSYPSSRAAWAAFLRDDVDVLYDVPAAAIPILAQNPDIRIYGSRIMRISTLVFNPTQRALRDVRIRQAINLAIDREDIERRLYGGIPSFARRKKHLIGPFSPEYWATEGLASPLRYDPVAARALIKDVSRDRAEPIDPMEIVCLTSSEYPDAAEVGAIVEAQLQRVHIKLRLQALPYGPLIARFEAGDFDAFIAPLSAGYTGYLPIMSWHSGGQAAGYMRDSGYAGADAALDRLYGAASPDAERAAVGAVVDAMAKDPPAAFLAPMQNLRAVRRIWRVPDDELDIRRSIARWTFDAPCGAS